MTDIKIDLHKITAEAVKDVMPKSKHPDPTPEPLEEAYVAEPKTYNQVTEYITEKTKTSHYNLYRGYAETLTAVSAKLDTADKSETNSNHANYRSLKLDETYNLNAVWLHELYFANCFDPNSELYMDSMAYMRLQRDWGTFEEWQKDFMASAVSSGEGWAVCGYHMFLQRYVNTVVSHHSGDVMLGIYPIVVVDMWSHAYYRDYLTDKSSYLVAMMKELNWSVIEERVQKAEKIAGALK